MDFSPFWVVHWQDGDTLLLKNIEEWNLAYHGAFKNRLLMPRFSHPNSWCSNICKQVWYHEKKKWLEEQILQSSTGPNHRFWPGVSVVKGKREENERRNREGRVNRKLQSLEGQQDVPYLECCTNQRPWSRQCHHSLWRRMDREGDKMR